MVGIDLVFIPRIEEIYNKLGIRFLKRFLNTSEIQLLESKKFNPKSIAGFWASKEAVSKALGCGIGENLSFKDIEIYYSKLGAPLVKIIDSKFKNENLNISISHDKDYAIAIAIKQ